MSKTIITAAAIATAAFFAGLACSWLIGQRIADRAMEESMWHLAFESESRVRASVHTLKLLERGDIAEAVRFNCNLARSALPLAEYATRIPNRKESVDRLASHAEQVIGGLEAAEKCGVR